jgi:7-cyano-7-deazaguanine synthase
MTRALVLLSGGQDSTTTLYLAKTLYDEVLAVSINYGQRHRAELSAAADIAHRAGVRHMVLDAALLGALGDSALVDASRPLAASGGHPDAAMPEGLPTSFVPARNMLFLTMAVAVAVKEGIRDLVTGVCQTDYSGYPDCRRDFIDAFERTATLALPTSVGPIRVLTPLMHLTKAETVKLAHRLPGCWEALATSITCYEGKRPGCGKCPACELRARGFKEAGFVDPANPHASGPFAAG